MRFLSCLLIVFVLSLPTTAAELPEHPDFSFITIGWADEVLGYQDYVSNEEGVFGRSSRAYAYMEVIGFTHEPTEVGYASHLTVSVSLHSASGRRLFGQDDLIDHHAVEVNPPDSVWFYIWVDIPWWAPSGEYEASVVVRDLLGEEVIEHSQKLMVR